MAARSTGAVEQRLAAQEGQVDPIARRPTSESSRSTEASAVVHPACSRPGRRSCRRRRSSRCSRGCTSARRPGTAPVPAGRRAGCRRRRPARPRPAGSAGRPGSRRRLPAGSSSSRSQVGVVDVVEPAAVRHEQVPADPAVDQMRMGAYAGAESSKSSVMVAALDDEPEQSLPVAEQVLVAELPGVAGVVRARTAWAPGCGPSSCCRCWRPDAVGSTLT